MIAGNQSKFQGLIKDMDGDGKVSAQEVLAQVGTTGQHVAIRNSLLQHSATCCDAAQLLQNDTAQFDKDGDGMIDESELNTIKRKLAEAAHDAATKVGSLTFPHSALGLRSSLPQLHWDRTWRR